MRVFGFSDAKAVKLMLPIEMRKFRHPSAPSGKRKRLAEVGKRMIRSKLLVDLVGIEPTTSSMPWKLSNRKL